MYLTQHPGGPRPPAPAEASCSAEVPPGKLDQHEVLRLGQAAHRAAVIYPGVVGEVLAEEVKAACDMQFRLHNGSRTQRLVTHLMTAPVPPDAA